MSTRLEATPVAPEHLSPEQLEELRRLLQEERSAQMTRSAELQDSPDLEPDLAALLLSRCQEALDEIDAALLLVAQGAYGLCVACGAAIRYERLEAVPSARHCVSCQAGRDRVVR